MRDNKTSTNKTLSDPWDTATPEQVADGLRRLRLQGPRAIHAKKGRAIEVPVRLSPVHHQALNTLVCAYSVIARQPVSKSLVIRHAIVQLSERVAQALRDPAVAQDELVMLMQSRAVTR